MEQFPLTIADAATGLRAGDFSAVELTTASLQRIEATNEDLGAFVTWSAEAALAAAEAVDADLAAGVDRGPLQGIPLAVKDIIATKDMPTTANSRILDPVWGAGRDAPVVARLRDAGGVVVGKATTSEFACGAPDPTKGFPIPRNPWNTDHSAAGSSSGTGIAVAAGLVLGGLGTDTGGSVRGPASANGCTGLKVTFGRVPKSGVVPLGYSLDSVGPLARSAYDCALLMEVMSGADAGDPDSADVPVPSFADALTGDLSGLRIGLPLPYFFENPGPSDEVRDAVLDVAHRLADAGAEVIDTEVPYAAEAKTANGIIAVVEGCTVHRNALRDRWEVFGYNTRDFLGRGQDYSAADYVQAQRVQRLFRAELAKVWEQVDVLLTPTSLGTAVRFEEMDTSRGIFSLPSFTGQWNLAGVPACAAPCGFGASGLPMSFQVVGKAFDEATVLRVVDAYQRVSDWHLKVPPVGALAAA
jgi:aspartyl-tRNA(Asn)/glutamyl-tRNA(Gln) amidotransferase subunit A